VIVVVGFANPETAIRNLKRGAQIENISFAVKTRESGYSKPSDKSKDKKKRAKARRQRDRAKNRKAS
jgi:ribosomal protein S21